MIFYFLVYSIIFFLMPATIEPYYSVSYPNKKNIFTQLPDEENVRFEQALTNICKNHQKNSSIVKSLKANHDELADRLKKLLEAEKEYKKFIFAVAHGIAHDKVFAQYLRSIKIYQQETLYSFFIREASRLKKPKPNLHQQKYLFATAQMVKENYKVAQCVKNFLSNYLDDRENKNKIVLCSSLNDPMYQDSDNSNNRYEGANFMSTGVQDSKTSKSDVFEYELPKDNCAPYQHGDKRVEQLNDNIRKPFYEDQEKGVIFYSDGTYKEVAIVNGVAIMEDINRVNDAQVGPSSGVLKNDEQGNDSKHKNHFDENFERHLEASFQRDFAEQVNKALLRREKILEEEYSATRKILDDPALKKKAFDHLSGIVNDLLALFATEPDLDLTLEQEEILDRLISSTWPSDLPAGSLYQNIMRQFKLNILFVMLDNKNLPKSRNKFECQKEKARIIAEFLKYTFGTTSEWDHLVSAGSKDASEYFIEKGVNKFKIPFLKEAHKEANRYIGRVESVATFFYDTLTGAGKSLASMPGSLFDTVADTLGFTDDVPNSIDYYDDLNKRRRAFLSGDYDTAFQVANKYWNTPYYQKMIEPLKKSFFDSNNEYGIPLDCQQDPLWINMPDQIKNSYRNSLSSWKNDSGNNDRFDYHKLKDLHELRSLLKDRLKDKNDFNSPQLKNESITFQDENYISNEYYHYPESDFDRPLPQDTHLTDLAKKKIVQAAKTTSMKQTVNNIGELEDRAAACGDFTSKQAFELHLEALQQAHLYQDQDCRQALKQLPEYDTFVCTIAQELERNPTKFAELRHTWWSEDSKNRDFNSKPINLETYLKSEAHQILQDKQNDLAKKSHDNFIAMNEHIIAVTDSYLDNLDKLPSFESKPEIRQQLQDLNIFAHEVGKKSFDQQDLHNGLSKINNGPLDFQDLADALNNNNNFPYRCYRDATFKNIPDPLNKYQGLEDLEKKIDQDPKNIVDESLKQLDDFIAERDQAQLIIDEYHIQESSLIKTYIKPEQQAIHEALKSKLAGMAPELNKNEKKLAASLAEAVISLNDAGRVQEARSFLDVFSVKKLNEFLDGITSGLKEKYTPDIDQLVGLSKAVLKSAVTQRIMLALAPELQIPYYIYQFATMARDTYKSGNLFVNDVTELLEVIKSGDMHRAGQLVVQTAHDGYDIYVGGKGLRNMGSSLVNTYNDIKKKRTGGSKRNNKKEKKERYNHPTCESMNDFLDNHELGKTVKAKSVKTGKYYGDKSKGEGAAIYRATGDIEGTPIKEGWHYYFDYTHKDHLEVFNEKGKIKTVMRLDGSIWEKKADLAKEQRRHIDI